MLSAIRVSAATLWQLTTSNRGSFASIWLASGGLPGIADQPTDTYLFCDPVVISL